jgi:hypothetical protein
MTSAPENYWSGLRAAAGSSGRHGHRRVPATRYGANPAHASRSGLAHGFTPGQLYRVTQPMLSAASNNARTYRPGERE